MKPRLFLLAIVPLLTGLASAQSLQKDKFHLGSWEHDIGYTQAIRVGDTLHISGSVGSGDMPNALREAFGALQKTLAHYGLDFRHVVKETIYTTDIEALKAATAARRPFYGDDFPTATWVQVSRLYDATHVVEVELTAVFPATTPPPSPAPTTNAPAAAH
jgi:enamine deaminase RidA (YjgF/YER057c/UK114 family)